MQLKVKPANVDEQLRKKSTGALAGVWKEQSAARTLELFDFSKQCAALSSLPHPLSLLPLPKPLQTIIPLA